MPEINEEVDDEYVDEQAVNRNLKGGGKRILFESLLDDFWPWYGDQGNLCQVTVGGVLISVGIFLSASIVHSTPYIWKFLSGLVLALWTIIKNPPNFGMIFIP